MGSEAESEKLENRPQIKKQPNQSMLSEHAQSCCLIHSSILHHILAKLFMFLILFGFFVKYVLQ